MFYIICVCGITLTLFNLSLICRQAPNSDKVVVFDSNKGDLWVGDKRVASYRKGSRNYRLVKLLYERQGEEVSYEDIKSEIFTQNEAIPLSKLLCNLRLPTYILNGQETHISLAQKVSINY